MLLTRGVFLVFLISFFSKKTEINYILNNYYEDIYLANRLFIEGDFKQSYVFLSHLVLSEF